MGGILRSISARVSTRAFCFICMGPMLMSVVILCLTRYLRYSIVHNFEQDFVLIVVVPLELVVCRGVWPLTRGCLFPSRHDGVLGVKFSQVNRPAQQVYYI
jgi:hypothetical protein